MTSEKCPCISMEATYGALQFHVLLEVTYGALHVPLEVTYETLHMSFWKQHMELSICTSRSNIWSTPYVPLEATYGALHNPIMESILCPRSQITCGFLQSKSPASLSVYKCTWAGINSCVTVPSKVHA